MFCFYIIFIFLIIRYFKFCDFCPGIFISLLYSVKLFQGHIINYLETKIFYKYCMCRPHRHTGKNFVFQVGILLENVVFKIPTLDYDWNNIKDTNKNPMTFQ